MKKFTLLFLLVTHCLLKAQEFRKPVDYLKYLGKEQLTIAKSTWRYTSAVAHSSNARKIETTRKQLVNSIRNSIQKIEALKNGYKGDVKFRDKLLVYLSIAEKNINEEYSKIIDLQDVAQQSYDFMETYVITRDLVNKKLNEEYEKVKWAQFEFAEKYHIQLSSEESEIGLKIKLSNAVFDYHTALFLLFFKVNITDVNLANAIEKKDKTAIEQYASTLLRYSNEGLEKIKTITSYKNDNSLVEETEKALLFYKKTAEEFAPKAISYLAFYDQFTSTKKSFESKPASERTAEEIENYNLLVQQVNREISGFNKQSNENYQEKTNVLNHWNASSDEFITRHVPQD